MGLRVTMVVIVAACGGAQPGPRIAVLPETWATTKPAAAEAAAPRITQALRAHDVTAISDDKTRQALAVEGEASATCVEDLACVQRIGERVGAGKVVTLRLAELGETVAVQVTLVDVHRAAREATLREVVQPNEAPRLAASLDALGARVAQQAGPERGRPRTWLWIGAGAVLAGLAAATIVLATGDDEMNPDTVIVPP